MTELFTKIYTAYSANTALKAAATMHPQEAPQGTSTPYIVYSQIATTTRKTQGAMLEEILLQFDIVGERDSTYIDDPGQVLAVYSLLTAVYGADDIKTIAGTSYNYFFTRASERLLSTETHWIYIVEYLVQKGPA